MAKVAAVVSERSERRPSKLDLEAVFAWREANLAAVQEAQAVLLNAAQAVTTLQAGYAWKLITRARDVLATREPRNPEAVLGGVKVAAETSFTMVRRSIDLGVAAQHRVTELVAARTRASNERLQALAA